MESNLSKENESYLFLWKTGDAVLPGPVLGAIGQFISGKILFSLMNVALAYKMIQKHFVCGELMQRQTIPCIFSQHLKILFLLCFGGALGLMALEGWLFARTGWMPVHMPLFFKITFINQQKICSAKKGTALFSSKTVHPTSCQYHQKFSQRSRHRCSSLACIKSGLEYHRKCLALYEKQNKLWFTWCSKDQRWTDRSSSWRMEQYTIDIYCQTLWVNSKTACASFTGSRLPDQILNASGKW